MSISWLPGVARVGAAVGVAAWIAAATAIGQEKPKHAASPPQPAAAPERPAASAGQIDRLIRQLGDPDYYARQHAQDELARIGFDAFDALTAATENEDPEIAARAKYLLRLIRVQLVAKGDPPVVRGYLQSYEKLDAASRDAVIRFLATLPDQEGADALCRLVLFERSPILSKAAAVALLPRDEAAVAPEQPMLDAIRARLGKCRRPGAGWLRASAQFADDPQAAIGQWSKLADEELDLWQHAPAKTSPEIVGCLLRVEVAWLQKLHKTEEAALAVHRLLDLQDNGDARSLVELVEWLVDQRVWPGIDELVRRFSARFDDEPILLYLLAEAQAEQGHAELAEKTAQRAFHRHGQQKERQEDSLDEQQEGPGRLQIPTALQHRGRIAWARREFERLIHEGETASRDPEAREYAAIVRRSLAEMLHDQGQDLDAAKALEGVLKVPGIGGPYLANTRARMHDFFACNWEALHEPAKQRAALDKALKADPEDVDVLIACYRLPGQPASYHARIVDLIERAAAAMHGRIIKEPAVSNNYNGYAWLVGSTQGDVDEAVRCSRKSIELHPDEAAYYDTLGHVYFGKGDWANAVKYQARAVELEPHSGLIVRDLKKFRAKLAEVKKAEVKKAEKKKKAEKTPAGGRQPMDKETMRP